MAPTTMRAGYSESSNTRLRHYGHAAGLSDVLRREFSEPQQPLADALTFCDMTTSPDGEHVHANRRLAEIHDRYGSGHLVSRSIRRATP